MKCSGIYTALITPFDAAGAIDTESLKLIVKNQLTAGVDGLVALGTTGEAPTLSESEKEHVVRTVRGAAPSLPLVVGCGSNSTTQTIDNVKKYAALGADCALIVTPFYNKPTQEGVFRHFEAICKSSPIPIIVYNHPGRTGVNIETPTLARIAQLPHIIGVKETSANIGQVCDVLYTIKQERPDFAVLSGDDNLTYTILTLGGDGVISGLSNLVPELMVELAEACRAENFAHARALNLALTPLFKALVIETPPIPLKALLTLAGLPAGAPRLPLTPLSAHLLPTLKATLAQVKEAARHG